MNKIFTAIKNSRFINWVQNNKVLALVIASIVLYALMPKNTDQVNYQSFQVVNTDVVDEVELTGKVSAVDRVDLSFAQSGQVARINFESGDNVAKGQIIATLKAGQLYAQLEQARAGVAAAEANLNETQFNLLSIKANNAGSITSLENAKENLLKVTAEQNQLVNNARRSLINNDLQAYTTNSSRYATPPDITGVYTSDEEGVYIIDMYQSSAGTGFSARYSGLETGLITFNDRELPESLGTRGLFVSLLDNSESYSRVKYVVPIPNTRSSTYQTVKNSYDVAVATRARQIEIAESELERLLAIEETGNLTATEESKALAGISSAQANLDSAKAQVDVIQSQINDRVLTTPFSGVLAKSDLEIGETVASGSVVATLVSKGEFEVELEVPEIDVAKLSAGMPATVTLDAYQDNISWQAIVKSVEEIETIVEGVPVYKTTLTINNPDDRIKVGMNARATIEIDKIADVVAVPASYLVKESDNDYVLVKNTDEDIVLTPVEIGFRGSDSLVEITSGVKAGQTIVKQIDEK